MKKAIILVSVLAVVIFVVLYCLLPTEEKSAITIEVLTEDSENKMEAILARGYEALLTIDLSAQDPVLANIYGHVVEVRADQDKQINVLYINLQYEKRPLTGDMVSQDDVYCLANSSTFASFAKYGKDMEWVLIPLNEINLTVDGKMDEDKAITCPPANKCSIIEMVWSKGKNNPKDPDNKFKFCGVKKLS